MIKEIKYTIAPILAVGKPIYLDLTGVSLTERILISLLDGTTIINPISLVADFDGTSYNAKVNQALSDYLTNIDLPDVNIFGWTHIPNFVRTITPRYRPISNTNNVVLANFDIINSAETAPNIGFWGLTSNTIISYIGDTDFLYFLNNLSPAPSEIKARISLYLSDNRKVTYVENTDVEPTQLYVLNTSLWVLAEQANVDPQLVTKIEVKLYDNESVSLSDTITYYIQARPKHATTIYFLNSVGVYERLTCVGLVSEQREIDSPKAEYNYLQYELYTHSFESIDLNTGILSTELQRRLSYQLAHSKSIMVLQPDGSYRKAVKIAKTLKQYNNQDTNNNLAFQLRYIETQWS